METQKSLLEVLEKRLDTNEEHIALLQSNDNEQDAKILGLEKADKFLQDTYAEGAKKTDQIEETATAQKHELEKLKGELDELSESCTNCEETIGKAIEEQASLSGLVEDIKEKIREAVEASKREDSMGYSKLKRVSDWMHNKAENLKQKAREAYSKKIRKDKIQE